MAVAAVVVGSGGDGVFEAVTVVNLTAATAHNLLLFLLSRETHRSAVSGGGGNRGGGCFCAFCVRVIYQRGYGRDKRRLASVATWRRRRRRVPFVSP